MNLKLRLARLQARASRIHGLSCAEFMRLTPREWNAIERDYYEEWALENEVHDRRIARVLVTLYRTSSKFKKFNKTEDDFMPKKRKPTNKIESAENLFAKSVWIYRKHVAFQKHKEKIQNGG
jgi:hypothetical protein